MGIESSNLARSFMTLYSLEMLLSVGITFRISDAESGFGDVEVTPPENRFYASFNGHPPMVSKHCS